MNLRERKVTLTAKQNNPEILSFSDKSCAENPLSSLIQLKYDFHQQNATTSMQ